MAVPPPDVLLSESGWWAYAIIAVVLLFECVPVIGALIPAQLFMLGAGFLTGVQEPGHHILHLYILIPVAFASLYCADIISFQMGRRYGMQVFRSLPAALSRRVRVLSEQLGTHAGKTLVFGKFLGPARGLAPPLAGVAGVGWSRFLVFEAIGSLVWVTVIATIGAFFGHQYQRLERLLGRGAVLVVLVLVVVYLTAMRLRAARKEERLEAEERRAPP
jgi:membrane-associated protein